MNSKLLVTITGPNGLLGREVVKVFKKECDVVELPHDILDITDLNQVRKALSSYMRTVLVNCAAYAVFCKPFFPAACFYPRKLFSKNGSIPP